MLRDSRKSKQKTLVLIGIAAVVCVVGLVTLMSRPAPDENGSHSLENGQTTVMGSGAKDGDTPSPAVVKGEIPATKTIDYKALEENDALMDNGADDE